MNGQLDGFWLATLKSGDLVALRVLGEEGLRRLYFADELSTEQFERWFGRIGTPSEPEAQ